MASETKIGGSIRKVKDAVLRRLRRPKKRVRSPTVLQMEAVECGAACLGIVLAHFDKWVALEELRLACGVSRDGSKASNIVKAARKYGLVPRGMKTEPKALRNLPAPMILHWNFNHFVVLDGFHKGRVHLNDPGSGPRTVSEEELDESFTGVVLTFRTGPGFERSGGKPSFLPALARRLVGSASALVFVLLTGLALVVPQLIAPVFSKVFIDNVLLQDNRLWMSPLLLAMGGAAVILATLNWLQLTYLLRLETRISLAGSSRFLWHVLRLPVDFFNQRYAGDISNRVGINNRVAELLSRDLATHFLAAVLILFFALLMVRYDLLLTTIGITVVSLNVVALRYVSRRRIDGNRQLQQEQGKLHGVAIGGLRMIETLKATGGESDLFARWSGYQAKVVNIRQDLERYSQFLNSVPTLLTAINTAAILGVGSLRVMGGALTLGELVAFQALMLRFVSPVERLVGLGSKLQLVEGDMNRLDDVLRYPIGGDSDEAPDTQPESPSAKLAGHLELRDLAFGYSPLDPPLIEDFQLTLRPGERVALVGGSGSGKSTVARLVTGLYEPWKGEILFDGEPRKSLPAAMLNVSLASVDQSILLFEGTVRENLTLWDRTIPTAEVVAAAKDAAIHDEISVRAGGYDSLVAEGGANWSGGQQQRLEIARALTVRPSILVLDEATSALDPTTEQWIDQSLRRRGCTCLIVAHRLSTIRDADEIVVLERGKIVQRGTHQQLVAEVDSPYHRLISAQ